MKYGTKIIENDEISLISCATYQKRMGKKR